MYFNTAETGHRIKLLRESKGYTQEQLAEKLNISRSYLSKLEIGERSSSIDLLIEISECFDITLDYLILGKKYDPTYIKATMQKLSKIISDLMRDMDFM